MCRSLWNASLLLTKTTFRSPTFSLSTPHGVKTKLNEKNGSEVLGELLFPALWLQKSQVFTQKPNLGEGKKSGNEKNHPSEVNT